MLFCKSKSGGAFIQFCWILGARLSKDLTPQTHATHLKRAKLKTSGP